MRYTWLVLFVVCVLAARASGQKKTKHYFYCHLPYGTMPDWTDSACKRYWSCDDYDLSLQTCPDDDVYSYTQGECAQSDNVDCEQQTKHFVDSLPAYLNHHTLLYTQGPIFTDDNGETQTFTESPYCQVANGSLPDWTDEGCKRYWNCIQFTLSLETCGENEAYYYGNGTCVNKDSFSCEDQNSNFRASLPAPRFPQDGVSTHATSTNFHTVGYDGSDEDTSGIQTTTDETDWHASSVKQPQHLVEPQEVVVSGAVCERLDVEELEAIVNTAIIRLTGCPEKNCTLTLFNFLCP